MRIGPSSLPALLIAASALGCGALEPAAPLTPPTTLCVPRRAGACRDAAEIERVLADPDLEILGVADPPHGIQGARVLTVASRGPRGRDVLRVKWRPHASTDDLNRPRKEVVAHAVQKLFLDPTEWVIPPAVGHCFPLASYRRIVDPNAAPTYPPSSCVAGILSYWLEGSEGLDDAESDGWIPTVRLQDVPRAPDPGLHDAVADMNLVCHLISHGDSHAQQFVVTHDGGASRVYVVDNSIAFGTYRNPDLRPDQTWADLLVPALRKQSVERLRRVTHADLNALAATEQYALRDDQLVVTAPKRPGRHTESAFRWVNGELQMGLTAPEIAILELRLRALVEAVDRGRVALYE